jgi:hypothetical protein
LVKQEREGRLPLGRQNRVNELLLPLTGIGDDSFYLNEHLGERRSILDFPTLRAYDEDEHDFQEGARPRRRSTHVPDPVDGRRAPA